MTQDETIEQAGFRLWRNESLRAASRPRSYEQWLEESEGTREHWRTAARAALGPVLEEMGRQAEEIAVLQTALLHIEDGTGLHPYGTPDHLDMVRQSMGLPMRGSTYQKAADSIRTTLIEAGMKPIGPYLPPLKLYRKAKP